MQKRVLAIHDISCVGRCSLTVALPILSVAGCDTSVLPTAVLSTHTGGFSGFTYRDLTSDIAPIATHWDSLGLTFSGMYSGFLGSVGQIDLVMQLFSQFSSGVVLVDPVMADNGELYSVFDNSMVVGMRKLVSVADIIVPNLTEATLLLDEPYIAEGYDLSYVEGLASRLCSMGAKQVVLTGISLEDGQLGAYCYDGTSQTGKYVYNNKVAGHYHGTGDIFGSALLGALMNGHSLPVSSQIAVDYTLECIEQYNIVGGEARYGVPFELALPSYIDMLKGK